MSTSHRTAVVTITAALFLSYLSTACGQGGLVSPPPEDALPVTKLTVSPAAEPDPPLKYALVPAYGDLQPGNAATSYYRAITLLPNASKPFEDESKWVELPLAEFPCDEARKWLEQYRNTLEEVRIATFRETCDWNHRVRELRGLDTVNFMLPEMNRLREIARVLRLKARLEIAERRFDDALATMTMGYRLAKNLEESPLLISALVGIAIAKIMEPCVIDWIEADGPNLYWALASLPDPLIDIRVALQQEMNLPLQMFPFLKDPEHADYTPEQWKKILAESTQRLTAAAGQGGAEANLAAESLATGLVLAGYPAAKQQLIAGGMDAAVVETMPVGQVVAIQSARAYQRTYQETMKWTLLPYWQAHEPLRESISGLQSQGLLANVGSMPCVMPIVPLLLPAIESAAYAPVRLQRDLAALQTIEAIRMSLARSGGQWPQTLDELSFAPTPVDPVTGHTITSGKTGDGNLELMLPPPSGRPASNFGRRFELELKK